MNVNDPLTELLSLPVNFTVEPLLTPNNSVPVMNKKRQQEGPIVSLKKTRLSLDDKDQKTKERILRNRAAAQESRDKKRRYIADLENNNKRLTEENERMNKHIKDLEDQNAMLTSQLEAFSRQLATLQTQIKFNVITATTPPILFNDFCDSARIAKKELIKVVS
ncbi:uncharacterized protein BX663DRAFT_440364 [Cokeromyces recurvatus]|uniref:uncharacterized protein n=1 Tax=Cokeromyces recurvatus TaxID=90255 RepID=UPI00221F7468|nr:uncharacterized protein BX663DRAFT_440364 [Cokeromyces recurvatus]KAI7899901.1 hypothetical protein BX663DRAFT_440364 [Cokeromyces recurvatus]